MIKIIVNELMDKDKSLVNPLLKAKVLASRIGNKPLAEWIENELNGYEKEKTPKYRTVNANAICDIYINGVPYKQKTPFPVLFLPNDEMREFFMKLQLSDGIESIENYFVDGNDTIYKPLGVDFENIITKAIKEKGFFGKIHNLSITTYKTEVIQAVSAIRNKFLNLMLELETEFPEVDDVSSESKEIKEDISNRITIIMAENNYTTGDGSNIVSGNNNQTNFSSGDNNTQTISLENQQEVKDVITQIKELIESNEFEEKEDAQLEVQRVENQLAKENPKTSVIQQSLGALKDIFTSVSANIISGPVIESITQVLGSIG